MERGGSLGVRGIAIRGEQERQLASEYCWGIVKNAEEAVVRAAFVRLGDSETRHVTQS